MKKAVLLFCSIVLSFLMIACSESEKESEKVGQTQTEGKETKAESQPKRTVSAEEAVNQKIAAYEDAVKKLQAAATREEVIEVQRTFTETMGKLDDSLGTITDITEEQQEKLTIALRRYQRALSAAYAK